MLEGGIGHKEFVSKSYEGYNLRRRTLGVVHYEAARKHWRLNR
jgi:hypothetical protein